MAEPVRVLTNRERRAAREFILRHICEVQDDAAKDILLLRHCVTTSAAVPTFTAIRRLLSRGGGVEHIHDHNIKKLVAAHAHEDIPDALKYWDVDLQTLKVRARAAVQVARKSGVIVPQDCGRCGADASMSVAHHPDYFKPLDIEWLCRKCHSKEHRKAA